MKKIWIFLLLFSVKSLFAQDLSTINVDISKYIQSPNAASLGKYGEIETSPFTGLPSININVFSLVYKGIPINASLSYTAGGVKLEEHPSWVGQNWSLNVGGVVTRKMNGGVDEVDPFTYSYYDHYDLLNPSAPKQWDDVERMIDVSQHGKDGVTKALLSPDEFFFSLPNGKSGSMFKSHLGNWVVKCNQPGKLVAEVFLNTGGLTLKNKVRASSSILLGRIINKFIITDDDGTKYIFGDQINAIEFIRGPRKIFISGTPEIIANAWYLVQIKSPQNNVVNLTYERGEHQFIQSVSYGHNIDYRMLINGDLKCNGNNNNGINGSGQVITPSYLTEISCNAFKISFEKAESIDSYPYNMFEDASPFKGFDYGDIYVGNSNNYANGAAVIFANPPKWYKLKTITVTDFNNVKKEQYTFDYNNDGATTNQRLFLNRFNKVSPPSVVLEDDAFLIQPSLKASYSFNYNDPAILPTYNSMLVDEWGYLNNKHYPYGTTNITSSVVSQLLENFKADTLYTGKGLLNRITYPTGGYTNYFYESNDYSTYIQKKPGEVNAISQAGFGGGMRIKKIVNYTAEGSQNWKEFIYRNILDPGTSSGILSGKKQFYIKGQVGVNPVGYFEYISNTSSTDVDYTNGRDVVYTEVKELMSDGSYNTYRYSNSNAAQYRDEVLNIAAMSYGTANTYGSGTAYFTNKPAWSFPIFSHTSREMERGQLLIKETYNAENTLIYKQENTYRDDAARFNEFVRFYDYKQPTVSCDAGSISEYYIEARKIYTYFPYQKSQTETFYNLTGGDPRLVTKNFVYDNNWRLLKEDILINSRQEIVKNVYKYPFDILPANDPSGTYSGMTEKNIISPVIEKTDYLNTVQTNFNKTNYYRPNPTVYPNLYVPSNVQNQTLFSNPLETKIEYHAYEESNGDNLSASQSGGPKISYQWGYEKTVPIAIAKNALHTEFFHENFEGSNSTIVLSGTTAAPAHTGVKYWQGPTYTVSWNKPVGRLYIINYWYKVNGIWRFKEADYSGPATLEPDNADAFDDISIYPKDATISTYTYSPMAGVTSVIDESAKTTYYEYDSFNRLKTIRDQDRNITKSICYNLAGGQTGCPIPELKYNEELYQDFVKNDCVNGTGSTVRYTVIQNTYGGATQAEANAKAQADIAANGQSNANVKGYCNLYAKVGVTSSYNVVTSGYMQTFTTREIGVFADEACMVPFTLAAPVTINYSDLQVSTNNIDPAVKTKQIFAVVIPAGANKISIGERLSGCSAPGGGGTPPVIISRAANSSTGSGETNVLPPGGGGGDDPGPTPTSTCTTVTITLLSGVGYTPKP